MAPTRQPAPGDGAGGGANPAAFDAGPAAARLSATEQIVLDALRHGQTEREIGQTLNRSRHTIHVHIKNIYRKLGVYSRNQLLVVLEQLEEPSR
jgi:DNA-binding NarL/FixJ family response regulator